MTLDKGQLIALTLGTHKSSCIKLADFTCTSDHRLQIVSRKSTVKVYSHTNA